MEPIGGSTINLTLTMPDGKTIQGSGPFSGDFVTGQERMDGALSGPSSGDSGDWAGKLRPCSTFQRQRCTEGFYKRIKTQPARCPRTSLPIDFGDLAVRSDSDCRVCIESVLIIPECRCQL